MPPACVCLRYWWSVNIAIRSWLEIVRKINESLKLAASGGVWYCCPNGFSDGFMCLYLVYCAIAWKKLNESKKICSDCSVIVPSCSAYILLPLLCPSFLLPLCSVFVTAKQNNPMDYQYKHCRHINTFDIHLNVIHIHYLTFEPHSSIYKANTFISSRLISGEAINQLGFWAVWIKYVVWMWECV